MRRGVSGRGHQLMRRTVRNSTCDAPRTVSAAAHPPAVHSLATNGPGSRPDPASDRPGQSFQPVFRDLLEHVKDVLDGLVVLVTDRGIHLVSQRLALVVHWHPLEAFGQWARAVLLL